MRAHTCGDFEACKQELLGDASAKWAGGTCTHACVIGCSVSCPFQTQTSYFPYQWDSGNRKHVVSRVHTVELPVDNWSCTCDEYVATGAPEDRQGVGLG